MQKVVELSLFTETGGKVNNDGLQNCKTCSKLEGYVLCE